MDLHKVTEALRNLNISNDKNDNDCSYCDDFNILPLNQNNSILDQIKTSVKNPVVLVYYKPISHRSVQNSSKSTSHKLV
jgi:hypothetical protein